jgi:CheY-like chemotaxis protein
MGRRRIDQLIGNRMPLLASHRRVLLVDDHYDTCLGMKRMLERRGYEITVAHSAEQAVEKVRTQEFDLLISDIGLPDRSGYDLMREVRLNKPFAGDRFERFRQRTRT